MKAITYNAQYGTFNCCIKEVGAMTKKKTHEGRASGQGEAREKRVSKEAIDALSGNGVTATDKSYTPLPPPDILISQAGSDHNAKSSAHRPITTRPSDELFELATRGVVKKAEAKVNAAITAAAGSTKRFTDERLFSARGSLMATRECIVSALRLAAARPRDVDGNIDYDSEPCYLKYKDKNLVYRNLRSLFESSLFLKFAALQKAAEDRESTMDLAEAFDTPMRKKMAEVVEKGVERGVKRGLEQALRQRVLFGVGGAGGGAGGGAARGGGAGLAARQWTPVPGPNRTAVITADGVTAAGGAAAGTTVSGTAAVTALPKKKRRRPPNSQVLRVGQQLMVNSHMTIQSLCQEYFDGINGSTALKTLEANVSGWRTYKNGRSTWNNRISIYNEVEQRIKIHIAAGKDLLPARTAAEAAVQLLLTATRKTGKGTGKPNFRGLNTALRAQHKAAAVAAAAAAEAEEAAN